MRKTVKKEQSWPQRETMVATTTRSAIGVEPPKPLEFTTCHRFPWMLEVELRNVMFGLLDFGLTLAPFLCIPLFVPFGMVMLTLCH